MKLRVKLLARPDHSVSLYEGLCLQDVSVEYRTFFAFREGGFFSRIFPQRKRIPSDAHSSFLFTFVAYANNSLGKRVGFNWRKSEYWLSSHLLSVGDIRDVHVVHYWPFYYARHIRALHRLPEKPRFVTLADFYEAEPDYVNKFYRQAYEQAGLVFESPINLMIDQNEAFAFEKNFCVPSVFTKNSYLEKFPEASIHVVGYGLMGRTIGQPRVIPERRNWIFVGQVCLEKGIHVLLDAMEALPALNLDLIGPIRHGQQEYFKDRFSRLKNVRWLGPASNNKVKSSLASYHAFVLPSLADSYSIAVIEALCEGLPVVVTNQCGVADQVMAYNLGRVCSAGCSKALTAALSEVALGFDSVVFEQGLRRFDQDERDRPYAVRIKDLYEKLTRES